MRRGYEDVIKDMDGGPFLSLLHISDRTKETDFGQILEVFGGGSCKLVESQFVHIHLFIFSFSSSALFIFFRKRKKSHSFSFLEEYRSRYGRLLRP